MIWYFSVPTVNLPAVFFTILFFYLKNVGFAPDRKIPSSDELLKHIASRLKLTGELWPAYLSDRDTTLSEYLIT